MRLKRLTEITSGLGASVMVGMGGAISPLILTNSQGIIETRPPVIDQVVDPAHSATLQPDQEVAELQEQREDLAENPLCRLASETIENPPAASQLHDDATTADTAQIPPKFPGALAGLSDKVLQAADTQDIEQAPPPVAIVPIPTEDANKFVQVTPTAEDKVQLVSYTKSAAKATDNKDYQLWVQGQLVATVRTQAKADFLAQRIESLINNSAFDPEAIAPTLNEDDKPAISVGERVLFVIDESATREDVINHELLAIKWANNLRLALNVDALDLVAAQEKMYQIEPTGQSLEGLASWYGPYFHGRLTANGETYDQFAMTAAHPSMPLGTFLKVTNLNNDKSVIIRLNDRGPYIPPRSLDLSLGAARCLNGVQSGVIPYKATIMQQRPTLDTEEI